MTTPKFVIDNNLLPNIIFPQGEWDLIYDNSAELGPPLCFEKYFVDATGGIWTYCTYTKGIENETQSINFNKVISFKEREIILENISSCKKYHTRLNLKYDNHICVKINLEVTTKQEL